MTAPRTLALALLAALLVGTGGLTPRRSRAEDKKADAPKFTPAQVTFFEKDVLPVLKAHCLKCHGDDPKKLKGELDLRTRTSILTGGESGPAVDLGKPADSLLIKAIHYGGDVPKMPLKGKMPDKDIATLEKWVKDGLPVTADRIGDTAKGHAKSVVTEEAKRYWAYQPVKRPTVPAVAHAKFPIRNPIDAFVATKWAAKNLSPVAPAERAVLIRRAYYDLTGLPPTPDEVDAFVKDLAPDAYDKLLDKLLASPQYGEKWGRHWLDVVRYGETNGYERDGPKPYAWRYRDYVIKSFNDDKPYDQFVREQLAGDEIAAAAPGGYNPDATVATGFYRLGVWDDEPADPLLAVFDGYDDIVATAGQAFLATTFNCARCHDHKADPIPAADYYKLVAFVRDVRPYSETRDVRSPFNMTDITPPEVRARYENELKERLARIAEITKRMEGIEDAVIKTLPAEDQRAAEGTDRPQVVRLKVVPALKGDQKDNYVRFKKERAELEKNPAPASQQLALSVNNGDRTPAPTHILVRGSPQAKGKEVKPGFPEVLGLPEPTIPAPKAGMKSSGRRTVLANWIASKENPLTARVFVNRVWQYHFGKGIVPTANDFGKLGEQPTHPELLDWLASDFVAGGWKLKRLHKLIMLSGTYQLSSQANDANLKADPANNLLWRFNMRRLSGEEVRDSILAVSGSLNLKQFGPSTYPKIPKEVLAGQSVPGQGWPTSPPNEANRRSVYAHVKRALRVPILVGFDQPDPDSSCPVRYITTVPTQSLGLLNGEFANEQAEAFARRLQKDAPNDVSAQVARAVRLTTGRVPSPDEVKKDAAFVTGLTEKHKLTAEQALARFCLLCLNSNEFVYLD